MIHWLLTQLELVPSIVFYERDLKERFPEEFDAARRDRLLRRVPLPDGVSYFTSVEGRTCILIPEGQGYLALDAADPDEDPLHLQPEDVAEWEPDLVTIG